VPLSAGGWLSFGLRPSRTPRAFARSRPSPVRARISSRSNSAKPPSTVSINRPCGVVVSAQASFRDRKPALRSPMAASVFRRSRVVRASRSSPLPGRGHRGRASAEAGKARADPPARPRYLPQDALVESFLALVSGPALWRLRNSPKHWNRVQSPSGSRRSAMPFDVWSDLAVTALCGAALVTPWISRDLAARGRQRRTERRVHTLSTRAT